MYESQTFAAIMQRQLERIPDGLDTREGSILWNALAPTAFELEALYIEFDWVLKNTFADTAAREYLIRRVAERGLAPYPATKAILRGEFSREIPIGARFSLEDLNYVALERTGTYVYRMQCETAGTIGNDRLGRLVPIDYIPGLEWARLAGLLIPGEDEEDTEHLRKRYFTSLNAEAFGGNVADYLQKVDVIQGVGGCKVYPVWNGGGTVKLVITAEGGTLPTPELVQSVQATIDPPPNQGLGLGVAPIGHVVTVEGVTGVAIDVQTRITYQDGYGWEDVREDVIAAIVGYFRTLATEWAGEDATVVRVSHIEVQLLGMPGILDVENTKLNGTAANLALGADEIPIVGVVSDGA